MYHMKMSLTDFLFLEIIIVIFVDYATNRASKCAEFSWKSYRTVMVETKIIKITYSKGIICIPGYIASSISWYNYVNSNKRKGDQQSFLRRRCHGNGD